MSSAQLPIPQGHSDENNNKSPDQNQDQLQNAIDPVSAEGSKSKKKNKKKKKKKKNSNTVVETSQSGTPNTDEVENNVAIESPVERTVVPEVTTQNVGQIHPEPVVEDKLMEATYSAGAAESEPLESNSQDLGDTEAIRATQKHQQHVSDLPSQPHQVSQQQLETPLPRKEEPTVSAALSETVEDIKESVPDNTLSPEEPLQVPNSTSVEATGIVQPQDEIPVEAALTESVDQIKQTVPEQVLIPQESEIPSTTSAPVESALPETVEESKESVPDQSLISSNSVEPYQTVTEALEPKSEDKAPVEAALSETVEDIKQKDPADFVVSEAEVSIPETKVEDKVPVDTALSETVEQIKEKEPEANIIGIPAPETHENDLFASSTTNTPLPWESTENSAPISQEPQTSDSLFGGSEEEGLPWNSDNVPNTQEATKVGDPFATTDADETLSFQNQAKSEAISIANEPAQDPKQSEQPKELKSEQATEDIFSSSKDDDFSMLINGEHKSKNEAPASSTKEQKVVSSEPVERKSEASELFGESGNDDFSALITGKSTVNGETKSVKPEKKFSFLELELDDELLEDDELLDEPAQATPQQPDGQFAQPKTRSYQPDVAQSQPQSQTQAHFQRQYQPQAPKPYNPYDASAAAQSTPSTIPSHLDMKKLNENKKKSDAYDFPIDLVPKKAAAAKPARTISQNQFAQDSNQLSSQQSSTAPSPGINQFNGTPVTLASAAAPVTQTTHSAYAPRVPSGPSGPSVQSAPPLGPPAGPPRSNTPGSGTSTASKPPPAMRKKQSSFFEELPVLPPVAPAKPVRKASNVSATSSFDGGFGGPKFITGYPGHPAQAPPSNPYANVSKPLAPPRMPGVNKYSQPSSPLVNQVTPAIPPQNAYASPKPLHQEQYGQSPYASLQGINHQQQPAAASGPPPVNKPSKYAPIAQTQPSLQPNLTNIVPGLNPLNPRRASVAQTPAPAPPTGPYQQPNVSAYSPNIPPPVAANAVPKYAPGVSPHAPLSTHLDPSSSYPKAPAISTNVSGLSPSANIISPNTPAASKYAPINHKRQASSIANQYDPYSLAKVQQQQQKLQVPPPAQYQASQISSQQHLNPPPQPGMAPVLNQSQPQGYAVSPGAHHQSLPPAAEKVVNPEQLLRRQFPLFSWGSNGKVTYLIPTNSYMQPNVNIVNTEKVLDNTLLKEFPSVTKKNITAIDNYLDRQIQLLSTSLSSKLEENELLLLQVLKSKLSKSTDIFNLGSTYNYIEPAQTFNEARLRSDAKQSLSKRQLIAMISSGQKEQALGLALSHQDYALALLISSVINKESWVNMVRSYVGHEFSGDNGLFVSTLFQILSGDVNGVIDEFKADPNKSSWAVNNWKELSNAVLANKPPSLVQFITEFGKFLIESGNQILGFILFFLGGVPISGYQFANSIKLTLYLEIYGLVLQEQGIPFDSTPVLLSHASYLADYNLLTESQRYLDSVTSQIKASKAVNPKVAHSAKLLSERLSGSGATEGGWFGRPKLDKVWGTLDKSLNKFIAGEESTKSTSKEGGVFSKFSPSVSRTSSYLSLQNANQQPQAYGGSQRQQSQTVPLHRPSIYAPTGMSSDQETFPTTRGPGHQVPAPPTHVGQLTSPSLNKTTSKSDFRANEPLKAARPPLPSNPYAPVQKAQQQLGTANAPLSQPPKIGATPLSSRASSPRASLGDLYGSNSSPNSRPSRYAPPANNEVISRRSSTQSVTSSHINEPLGPKTSVSAPVKSKSYVFPQTTPGSISAPSQQAYKPPVAQSPAPLPSVSQIPSQPQSPRRPLAPQSPAPLPTVSQIPSQAQSPQLPASSLGTHIPPPPISRNNSGIAAPPKTNRYGPPPMTKSPIPPIASVNGSPDASIAAPAAAAASASDPPLADPVVLAEDSSSSIVPEQPPVEISPEVQGATEEEFPGEKALDKQVELTGDQNYESISYTGVEKHVQTPAAEEIQEDYGTQNGNDPEDGFKKEEEFDLERDFDNDNKAESDDFDVGVSVVTQYEAPKQEEAENENSIEEQKDFPQLSFDASQAHKPQIPVNPYAPPPPPPSNPYAPPIQAEKKEEPSAPTPMSPPKVSDSPNIPGPPLSLPPKKSNAPSVGSKRSSSASRFTPRSYTPSNVSHGPGNFAASGDLDFNVLGSGYTPSKLPEVSTASPLPPQAQETRRSSVSDPVASNPHSSVNNVAPFNISTPTESKFNPYQPNGSSGQSFDGAPSGAPTLDAKKPSQFAPIQPSESSPSSTMSSTYAPPSAKFTAYEPPKANNITPVPEDDEYYDDVVEDEDDDDEEEEATTTTTNSATNKESKISMSKKDKEQAGGWFGWLRKDKNEPKVYRAKLGEENKLVYDENLKRWVDKNAKPEDLKAAAAPPPPPVIKKKPSSISKPRSDSVSDGGSLKSPSTTSTAPSLPTPGQGSSGPGGLTPPPGANSSSGLPPPRKVSASTANDLDSLIGLSGAGAPGAASTRRKKRGGRGYVDVMGTMQQQKK